MLSILPQNFSLAPIIAQVSALGNFRRLDLNLPKGEFFGDPWELKPEIKNTPLGNVLESLGDIGQARLLTLESAESYTAHCDPDDRLHLAIITNPYSFLVDITDNKLFHLPADGQLWKMDTGKIHVAANWGTRARIHLNIRVLLPKYNLNRSSLRIKVIDGDYDWKQLVYTPVMQVINKNIKTGYVYGFKSINEKEVIINTDMPEIFDSVFSDIEHSGIQLSNNFTKVSSTTFNTY
jgi:Aspartyl/Asparaginyl beta-hydroxylase